MNRSDRRITSRSRRLRWLVLGAIVVGGIGAWTQFSVLSPRRGWVQELLVRFVRQYQSVTAWAPCEPALSQSTEVHGLVFSYPACYGPVFEMPLGRVHSVTVFDKRQLSGFSVVVTHQPSGEDFARVAEMHAKLRNLDCRFTERNGWRVWNCSPEHPDLVRRSVEMAREPWIVRLDSFYWPHVVDTGLSEFVDNTFDDIVADICEQRPDETPPD